MCGRLLRQSSDVRIVSGAPVTVCRGRAGPLGQIAQWAGKNSASSLLVRAEVSPLGARGEDRTIQPVCDLRATSVAVALRYGASGWATVSRAMMAYVISDGRLLALRPSEWSTLLVGVALCGLAVLLF